MIEALNNLLSSLDNLLDKIEFFLDATKKKTDHNLERITVLYTEKCDLDSVPKYSTNYHFFGYSPKYGYVRIACNKPSYTIGDLLSGIYHDKQFFLYPGTVYKVL